VNNDTPYHKITIDLDEPLPQVEVPAGYYGLGVFLRRNGEPAGYFHAAFPASTILQPSALADLVIARAGQDIIRTALRRVLPGAAVVKRRVTVAICTKDRAWSLERCLQSLTPLQYPNEGDEPGFEILVVDNAPSDSSTRDLVQSQRAVRYVLEPRPGLDFARNAAVQNAAGEYVAFLDDDVTVDRAWFSVLLRTLAANPDAGAITGSVMPMELASRAQVLFEERGGFSHGFGTIRHTQHTIGNITHPCNAGMFGAGCNMVFSRELLLRIGLFDEALDTGRPLPGGGDLDIFYRVLRADRPLVYAGNMAVYHRHRPDYKGLRRQMWTWGLGYMAFAMKNYRSDVESRFKLRLMTLGFFVYVTRMAVLSVLGRYSHEWALDLTLWETVGALQGLAGEYGRSRRRIDAIRARYA
jgi:glycosyltransferase involved in cell wall biosynthesis